MAFTTRGDRQTMALAASTPANVGPGAYLGPQIKRHEHNYAPFASTAIRSLDEHPPKYTPGPGAYNAEEALLRHKSKSTVESPAFASRVDRLYVDKTGLDTPAPGTYQEGNAWIKNKHRYKGQSNTQRVSYKRAPTAPSVPARHQSYGYEEGSLGELVMQAPPEQRRTGRGIDRAGPGDYDPSMDAVKVQHGNKAAGWSHSKTVQHQVFNAKESPGPGEYNPKRDLGVEAESDVNYRTAGAAPRGEGKLAKRSSNFASKVPRPFQTAPESYDVGPGPGTYAIVDTKTASSLTKPPPEHQFFGTSAKRNYQVDKTTSLHSATNFKTPGPGSYNTDKSKPGRPNMTPADRTPAFASTTTRFQGKSDERPAVGVYDQHDGYGMAAGVHKKLVSRNGAFGSAADRFRERSGNPFSASSPTPSPGSYDPEATVSPQKEARQRKPSSMFTSATGRFNVKSAPPARKKAYNEDVDGPKYDPAALGPGTYTLPDQWGPKNRRRAANVFISQEDRFGSKGVQPGKTTTPGPGTYSHTKEKDAFKPFVRPVPGAGFSTQSSRFRGNSTYSPGPGAYEASSDIVKRSFNVTVDEMGFY
eukprot:jgi/Tetstr1/461128/TSEL_006267.t1